VKDLQNLTDEQLAAKALENVDFFGFLIERFESKLKNFVLRISNFSPEIAEEILQETFLKAWKNLQDFDPKQKFSTWIFTIARRETISNFRKFSSRGEDKKVELDESLFENLGDKISLESDLDLKLEARNVQRVLQLLPVKFREILILFFLEEKSHREISDILQIPTGSVGARISRAKKQFATKWQENFSRKK